MDFFCIGTAFKKGRVVVTISVDGKPLSAWIGPGVGHKEKWLYVGVGPEHLDKSFTISIHNTAVPERVTTADGHVYTEEPLSAHVDVGGTCVATTPLFYREGGAVYDTHEITGRQHEDKFFELAFDKTRFSPSSTKEVSFAQMCIKCTVRRYSREDKGIKTVPFKSTEPVSKAGIPATSKTAHMKVSTTFKASPSPGTKNRDVVDIACKEIVDIIYIHVRPLEYLKSRSSVASADKNPRHAKRCKSE